MYGIVVRFDIRDDDAAREFDRLTATAVEHIRADEPGTLLYATHPVREEPLARVFYEIYADADAWRAHEANPHVQQFHAQKDPLLTREPRVELLDDGPAKGGAALSDAGA